MNIRIKVIIALITIFYVPEILAQKVVLEEDVQADSIRSEFGQNRKHFRHFYLTYGFVAGNDNMGSQINYGLSRQIEFGYRYKRKLSNWYALGISLSANNELYNLKQSTAKILPNDSLHDSEKLIFNDLKAEIYNRINLGKRGDIIGRFIDIGFYTGFNYRAKHIVKDILNDDGPNHAKKAKHVYTGLSYVEKYKYGLMARTGINRYVLYMQYRLNNQLKHKNSFEDLPSLIVGMQIGLY